MVKIWAAVAAVSVSALGCGAEEPAPDLKLHLQLEGAAPSATQYDVLVFGQAVTCAAVTANVATVEASALCGSSNADTSTCSGADGGAGSCCHISHDQLSASGSGQISGVSVGTRTVFVEALAGSSPVGNGCATAVVKSGQSTAVTITVK